MKRLTRRVEISLFREGPAKRLSQEANCLPKAKRLTSGRNDSIGGETSHIGGQSVFRGAKRLTSGRSVLNGGKSSQRRGAKHLENGCKTSWGGGGGRNICGAKCPRAPRACALQVDYLYSINFKIVQ